MERHRKYEQGTPLTREQQKIRAKLSSSKKTHFSGTLAQPQLSTALFINNFYVETDTNETICIREEERLS